MAIIDIQFLFLEKEEKFQTTKCEKTCALDQHLMLLNFDQKIVYDIL